MQYYRPYADSCVHILPASIRPLLGRAAHAVTNAASGDPRPPLRPESVELGLSVGVSELVINTAGQSAVSISRTPSRRVASADLIQLY